MKINPKWHRSASGVSHATCYICCVVPIFVVRFDPHSCGQTEALDFGRAACRIQHLRGIRRARVLRSCATNRPDFRAGSRGHGGRILRGIFVLALAGALSTQAHAQGLCSDARALSAVQSNLVKQIWDMEYRHLAAEYVGVAYDNYALMSSPVSAAAWRFDDQEYHNVLKLALGVVTVRLENVADQGAGRCSADLVYIAPPTNGDPNFAAFGSGEKRYQITFSIQPNNQDGTGWTVSNLAGEKPLLGIWHAAVAQLYPVRFAAYLKDPAVKQKLDELRASAAAENRGRQQAEARERQLAAECKSRGGFWGHHEIQRKFANGAPALSKPAGDPDHCIMN